MAYDNDPSAAGERERAGELTQVERALAGLAPRPARLDSARLLFLAGQESATRRPRPWGTWFWPAATAVATLAASIFGVVAAVRPTTHVVERIVYVQHPQPESGSGRLTSAVPGEVPEREAASNPAPSETPVPQSQSPRVPAPHYLQARNQAMSRGIDSLPAFQDGQGSAQIQPVTYRELQHRILEGESTGLRKLPEPGFYSWPGIILTGGGR